MGCVSFQTIFGFIGAHFPFQLFFLISKKTHICFHCCSFVINHIHTVCRIFQMSFFKIFQDLNSHYGVKPSKNDFFTLPPIPTNIFYRFLQSRFLKNILTFKKWPNQVTAVRKGRFCNFLDEFILSNMFL